MSRYGLLRIEIAYNKKEDALEQTMMSTEMFDSMLKDSGIEKEELEKLHDDVYKLMDEFF